MSEAKRIAPLSGAALQGLTHTAAAGGSQKGAGRMSIKYIRYDKPEVYGIIYKSERVIYYNIGFVGQTKLFILCP